MTLQPQGFLLYVAAVVCYTINQETIASERT